MGSFRIIWKDLFSPLLRIVKLSSPGFQDNSTRFLDKKQAFGRGWFLRENERLADGVAKDAWRLSNVASEYTAEVGGVIEANLRGD